MYRIKYNNSESFTHRQVNILISLYFKSDISAHKAFLDIGKWLHTIARLIITLNAAFVPFNLAKI
jgi:hypothetical protein